MIREGFETVFIWVSDVDLIVSRTRDTSMAGLRWQYQGANRKMEKWKHSQSFEKVVETLSQSFGSHLDSPIIEFFC